ncbi:hypothetical protein DPEC_G00378310, partial [Dallia pectoralis]
FPVPFCLDKQYQATLQEAEHKGVNDISSGQQNIKYGLLEIHRAYPFIRQMNDPIRSEGVFTTCLFLSEESTVDKRRQRLSMLDTQSRFPRSHISLSLCHRCLSEKKECGEGVLD